MNGMSRTEVRYIDKLHNMAKEDLKAEYAELTKQYKDHTYAWSPFHQFALQETWKELRRRGCLKKTLMPSERMVYRYKLVGEKTYYANSVKGALIRVENEDGLTDIIPQTALYRFKVEPFVEVYKE